DDGGPALVDGRRLVAERLAAAGGQDDERVASLQHGLHRLLLERAQGRGAPGPGDEVEEVGERPAGPKHGYLLLHLHDYSSPRKREAQPEQKLPPARRSQPLNAKEHAELPPCKERDETGLLGVQKAWVGASRFPSR